jgi:outer membrane lipoprotein carrier protein
MMKRIFTSILLSLSFFISGTAQDADALLSKLSENANTFDSIDATYTSTILDVKSDFEETLNGYIQIEENKFKLDLGEFVIITDGVSVWTYEKESNDCYIEDAEMLAEQGIDPSKIFTIWEDDFKNEWMGVRTLEGRELVQVNLYPTGDEALEKAYHTIQLFIDESALEVVQLVIKGRSGVDTDYQINSFKTGINIPASTFLFTESDFPGVTMIDNRI